MQVWKIRIPIVSPLRGNSGNYPLSFISLKADYYLTYAVGIGIKYCIILLINPISAVVIFDKLRRTFISLLEIGYNESV